MDKPFLPYDRDDSPEPETPIDVSKNPLPQSSKVLKQPDGTEVEAPVWPDDEAAEPTLPYESTPKKKRSKKKNTEL